MTMRKNKMNVCKKETIDVFYKKYKESKKNIFKRIADVLDTSRRREVSLNLSKLDSLKNVVDGSIVIVPGKVLGVGNTEKKIVVYAYSFSKTAKDKLKESAKNIVDFTKDSLDYKKCIIIK